MVKNWDHQGMTGVWRVRLFANKQNKMVVLTNLGTVDDKKDWANNFHGKLIECDSEIDIGNEEKQIPIEGGCEGGKIHLGFSSEWVKAKGAVAEELQKLFQSGLYDKLLVAGHSKGGAISYLMSTDIANSLPNWELEVTPKIYTITFGAPRLGDQKFVQYWKKLNIFSQRYVENYDAVPKLLPGIMGYVQTTPAEVSLPCFWRGKGILCHGDYHLINSKTNARKPFISSL
eukprot:TRINITY_DN10083_c0_g1_i1.p2 TRINITY_DN10083_c0_g1~~TRINITY_DN10083_c0_g1_i1.p2  ORF type:complete len:230 (-),score=55.05 TRINITY_DN10083_c0_g1_i1:115-804(-)